MRKTINSVTKEADTSYYYDGSPYQLTDYGGTTYTYGYNSYAQPQSVGDGTNTYASGATYQPSGALATLTHQLTSGSASYTRSFTPNALLQPSVIQAYPTSSPSSPIFKLTYGYGSGTNNGSITSITDGASGHSGRNQSFSYDTLNRLYTATVGSSTWGTQYVYDQFGNLIGGNTVSGYSAPATWTATQTNNRISTSGYDSDGRATTVNGSILYGYDAEGRVLSSNSTSYVYDGDGYRVKKAGSSTTLYWPGPSGALIDESNSGATSFGRQVWFGGLLVWNEDTSGNGRFLFQDHLGSTRVTASASGTVLDDIDYAPFGAQIANHGSATNNHYNFTGYETDDDGSNYATFRNMDSVHGRFGRPDPYLGSYDLTNPQSLNRYAYVMGQPTIYTDSLGLNVSVCITTNVYDGTSDDPVDSWTNCIQIGGSGAGYITGDKGGGGGAPNNYPVPTNPCLYMGNSLPPSAYAQTGAADANNPTNYFIDAYKGFPAGHFLDGQVLASGSVGHNRAYGNYTYGVFMAAAGRPLTTALFYANAYAFLDLAILTSPRWIQHMVLCQRLMSRTSRMDTTHSEVGLYATSRRCDYSNCRQGKQTSPETFGDVVMRLSLPRRM